MENQQNNHIKYHYYPEIMTVIHKVNLLKLFKSVYVHFKFTGKYLL